MNFKNPLFFVVIATIVFAACKKTSLTHSKSTTTGIDVYIAGYIPTLRAQIVAAYWKNAIPIKLTDSITTVGNASGIAVQGSDVYVSGNTSSLALANHIAMYWKNGVATQLMAVQSAYSLQHSDALESVANGIAVQNNNVYVVGYSTPTVASIWVNGTLTKLADDPYYSEANAITLQGSDVYVAGLTNVTGHSVATYWKNGVQTMVSGNTPTSISVANAIAVIGNDVYLAGYIYSGWGEPVAAYWKNGTAVVLEPTDLPNTSSSANGVCVNGSDVYVVGNAADGAICWKNGVRAAIGGPGSSSANAIVILKDSLYAAGRDYNKITAGAAIWKNNVSQIIGSPVSVANAIAISPH